MLDTLVLKAVGGEGGTKDAEIIHARVNQNVVPSGHKLL